MTTYVARVRNMECSDALLFLQGLGVRVGEAEHKELVLCGGLIIMHRGLDNVS